MAAFPSILFSSRRLYSSQTLLFYTVIFLIVSASFLGLFFNLQGDFIRNIVFFLCLLVSLFASLRIFRFYQSVLSPPLIFYLYIVIVWLITPFAVNEAFTSYLSSLSPTEMFPPDNFFIYAGNFLLFSLLVIPLSRLSFFSDVKSLTSSALSLGLNFKKTASRAVISSWFIAIFILFLSISLTLRSESVLKLCVLPFCFLLISLLQQKLVPIRMSSFSPSFLVFLAVLPAYTVRFVFSLYLFALIYFSCLYAGRITVRRYLFIFFGSLVLVIIYSLVSYVYKLNSNWGGQYTLSDFMAGSELALGFLFKQIYRIAFIWPVNSGNVIEYFNGELLNGASYLDFLLSFLGHPFVSLPDLLTVTSPGATYVQPGLFGEAYVNFGLLAPAFVFTFLFLLIASLFQLFILDLHVQYLLLSIVPFLGIIVDGGSLTSPVLYIAIWAILFPRYFLYVLSPSFWVRLIRSNTKVI
jgi:hypothetical protein